MSLWSALKGALRNMIGTKTIEQLLHVTPAISAEMEEAIQLWTTLYKDEAYWLHEPTVDDPVMVVSLGLPALIASEKARMVLIEFKSEITTPVEEVEQPNPDFQEPKPDIFGNVIPSAQPPVIIAEVPVGDTARAEFLNSQYEKLKNQLRKQLEYGIAKGGLIIKPFVVISNNDEAGTNVETFGENEVAPTISIEFNFIQADNFYPLAFDASGNITEAAFIDIKAEKENVYRRLEHHKWTGNKVEIENKAFKSQNGTFAEGAMTNLDLGQEISLKEVPEWSAMPPKTIVKHVTKPLYGYFRMPEANTVDTKSPLGVSGFSRAVKLIREADRQYSRLLWEYEGGELAIDIDRDALREDTDREGNTFSSRPHLQQRLTRSVDLGSHGDTYFPFAPSLRDTSYIAGLNALLMRIEDVCGISRGILSDASAEARTATELKILKQRSYQANLDIQKALENTLRDVIYVMDVYCTLYNAVGDVTLDNAGNPIDTNKGQWDVSFEWDDSILTDVDEELNKRIVLMQNGLASKLENRMWYFGETERQAEEALRKIQDESRQVMEENLMMQSNMAMQQGGNE